VKANGGAVLPFLHIISTKNKKGNLKFQFKEPYPVQMIAQIKCFYVFI
jgi:hypothetical protein